MKFSNIIKMIVFQTIFCLATESFIIPESGQEDIRPNLVLVTTVEGKSFFSDCAKQRNWTEAFLFCQSMRMRLASITSPAQLVAIDNSTLNWECIQGHWTSGHDANEIRQFTWNATGTAPSSSYLTYRNNSMPALTCLAIYHSNWVTYLYPSPCSALHSTMCETQ